MTIKEKLQESGRYEQILEIIANICCIEDVDTPVRLHYDREGKVVNRVQMKDVRDGIKLWYQLLKKQIDEPIDSGERLDAFEAYVETNNDMMLHNYANEISHRKTPSIDMERDIRPWLVLWETVVHMINPFDCDGEVCPFSVASGWIGDES